MRGGRLRSRREKSPAPSNGERRRSTPFAATLARAGPTFQRGNGGGGNLFGPLSLFLHGRQSLEPFPGRATSARRLTIYT